MGGVVCSSCAYLNVVTAVPVCLLPHVDSTE